MEVEPDQLVHGEIYLLKWASVKPDGSVHNMAVLECEFLHHYNNQYAVVYENLIHEGILDESLTGNILNEQGTIIQREFEDPLYPYSDYLFFTTKNIKGIGLFRAIRLVSTTFKGVISNEENGFKNNKYDKNPYTATLFLSSKINTGNKINMGETLMWVNLDRVKIIKKFDREKPLQEKGIDAWMSELPDDITNNTKTYLGGRKRKTRRKSKRKTRRKSKRTIKNKK